MNLLTPSLSNASSYVLNGFTDWYLPSHDELNLLYQNQSVVGGFINKDYWSSTEFNVNSVSAFTYFNNGYWYQAPKNAGLLARAIRSF